MSIKLGTTNLGVLIKGTGAKEEQTKSQTITTNTTTTITPDSGKTLSSVSITTNVQPSLTNLSITPSTSSQTFNHSGYDGYDSVSVSAVSSSIDSNIQAGNIKKDVSILGVVGTFEGGSSDTSLIWGGKNPVLVETQSITINLANDTTYSSTTPTTTAQTIFTASQSAWGKTTANIDIANYDYFVVCDMYVRPVYTTTPTTNYTLGEALKTIYGITRTSSGSSGNRTYNTPYSMGSISTNKYVASSNIGWSTKTNYVIVFTPTSPTLSSSSSGTPKITLNNPALGVRTQSSYMAQGSWANLDASNTNVYVRYQVIRVDKNNSSGTGMEHTKSMINDGTFPNNMV